MTMVVATMIMVFARVAMVMVVVVKAMFGHDGGGDATAVW